METCSQAVQILVVAAEARAGRSQTLGCGETQTLMPLLIVIPPANHANGRLAPVLSSPDYRVSISKKDAINALEILVHIPWQLARRFSCHRGHGLLFWQIVVIDSVAKVLVSALGEEHHPVQGSPRLDTEQGPAAVENVPVVTLRRALLQYVTGCRGESLHILQRLARVRLLSLSASPNLLPACVP